MSIGRTLTLAGILAGSMIIGTAVPSIALWTTSSTPLTASASAGTMGASITGFAALVQAYTPTSTSRATTLRFGNTGTLPTTYQGSVTLAAGSSDTMAGKVVVKAWPETSATPCDGAIPGSALAGTWAAFPALTGSLAAGDTAGWCVNTTLATADQPVTASVSPTYALTLSAGSWTATAAESASQTVPDVVAPTVPTGLAAAGTTAKSTTLSWNASTDNVGVAGYRVYISTDGGVNYTLLATQTTRSYTATGLLPVRKYTFAVNAFDAAGNESDMRLSTVAVTSARPSTTAWYSFVSDKSPGMCLDVNNEGTASGTALIQYGCHGHANQQFKFDASGHIIPRNAQSLGWSVAGEAAGAVITVNSLSSSWPWVQLADAWELSAVPGSSSYQFKLQGTTMCASVKNASTASNTPIELRSCDTGKPEQTFRMTEMAP